ncbi:Gfo/Idh/MocA family oxidoreductase [Micromonospora ureilytica]|uniref:Gfo/Idh/MocA family oxidoreductase n=1 Tax=Micromonospora ureilytica TaxID=709868 RepID=UPI002E0EC246|nr:Gfo/Idh/MocA family oxidoreductase [Micromonospora ureilytica]
MPNLAIIGAGIMGANHGRVARATPDVTVTTVCDPDPQRAATLAKAIGADYTTDLDEALAGVDAAILATPSETHGELGARILRSGRDLLVEKPIATSVADAQHLIDLAEKHDRVLMVGHVERFNPAVTELLQLVDDPLSLEITRVGPFSNRALADVLLDLMIHDVDLARTVAGSEIVAHRAATRIVRSAEQDLAFALLMFENGMIANITASRVSQQKIRRVTLTQRNDCVIADLLRQQVEVHRIEHSEFLSEGGVRYRQSGRVEIPFLSQHGEPLMHELRHFADCVVNRRRPVVSGEDGLAALEVCLQIRDTALVG